jgi:CheY-like chemotaxis protein
MRRYLVVDDNADFADNLAEILVDAGAHVDVATVGNDALACAARSRYDALVSDMRMPLMGGAELVQQIRRIDPELPAVVITAYTNDHDLAVARQEGVLAVLPKPTPTERLVELLGCARRGGLVVLVEDDPILADNLTEVLRAIGMAAVTATTVLETDRLVNVRPFVAIVDMRVPGGIDGAAMERLAVKYRGLPMISMSGHDVSPPEHHHAYFRKPFATADLVTTLEALYRTRET